MKTPTVLLSLALATAGLSCGDTAPPSQQTHNGQTAGSPADVIGPASPGTVSGSRLDGDAPPEGTRFHLFCDAVEGPSHVIRATELKAELIQRTGLRSWHIVHTADRSSVFFGYYRSISADDVKPDPADVARAHADLRRINEMTNAAGNKLFRSPMFLPINIADPSAPPEWNLVNAPAHAYWSLQICAYRGVPIDPSQPDRKQCAVDDVRELRAAGVEAYYFHGDTVSSVCVGAWPPDAIKRQDSDHVETSTHQEGVIPLVTNEPIPDNIDTSKLRNKEGDHIVVNAPKLEILDPSLKAAIEKYPTHAVNGVLYGTKGRDGKMIPDCSFLVLVPHPENIPTPLTPMKHARADDGAGDRDAVDRAAAGAILGDDNRLPGPTPAGRGRLRSIDDR